MPTAFSAVGEMPQQLLCSSMLKAFEGTCNQLAIFAFFVLQMDFKGQFLYLNTQNL